jgi:hypothetical protein
LLDATRHAGIIVVQSEFVDWEVQSWGFDDREFQLRDANSCIKNRSITFLRPDYNPHFYGLFLLRIVPSCPTLTINLPGAAGG